ncbi:MAG: AraC family transcriptional regulator [Nevskiaceae bacterium]
MTYPDVRRSITAAQQLVQLGREYGLPLDQSLSGTDLSQEAMGDSNTEIDLEQELQLTRNVVGALKHVPALGLEAGLRFSVTSFGVVGFAILSSSTIRQALDVTMRFHSLVPALCKVYVRTAGAEMRMITDDSECPADLRDFSVERSLASAARIWREVLGVQEPMPGLRLRMPRPAWAARMTEIFRTEPRFGAEDNSYVIEPAVLDQPVAFGNPLVAQQVEKDCKALLDKRRKRKGLAEKVRDIILHEPGRVPSLEDVAATLSMTTRTLRRHLVNQRTSYRHLVEEVRQTLAQELLTTGRLKMEEVAERLGYSDATSFSHAFRRWRGHAPSDLR